MSPQKRRYEKPLKRTNPGGDVVWVARFTNPSGQRRSAGTFGVCGPCRLDEPTGACCAQHAIDAAYERAAPPRGARTVGEYAEKWPIRHPRADRTNATNTHRVGRLLDVEVEGRLLRHWPYNELRPRHVVDLVDELLRVQGRAAEGAQGILRAYSAMTVDAITDEVTEFNVFRDVRVRANDPRIVKAPKRVRVCTWAEMHGFAAAAATAKTGQTKPRRVPVYGEPVAAEVSREMPVFESHVTTRDVAVPGASEEIAPGVERMPVQRVEESEVVERVKVGTREVVQRRAKRPIIGYREVPAEPSEMDRWREVYAEPMLRVLSDCGLRIGELLPLWRIDLRPAGPCAETIATKDRGVVACPVTVPHLHVRRTSHEGMMQEGTKTTHGTPEGGRAVPVPLALEAMLRALPARLDTSLMFTTPRGALWRERNFYRDVWDPAREATELQATPHGFRHSWISLLQAAGVDHGDLAEMAGHTVETMHGRYSHALGRSFEAAAQAVGA